MIEKIAHEIDRLFDTEISKYRKVTSSYNAMLKRKNMLELKIFKKKYESIE
jgi:hypothetical protein